MRRITLQNIEVVEDVDGEAVASPETVHLILWDNGEVTWTRKEAGAGS